MSGKHVKSRNRFYRRGRDASGRRMSRAAGLSPGTLIHIGERKTESTVITAMAYNGQSFKEQTVADIRAFAASRQEGTVYWLNVDGLHDVEVIRTIGDCFGIHPLVLEDVLNTNQRPKFEDFSSYYYIVFKMLYISGAPGAAPAEAEPGELVDEQVSLILGRDIVISFGEKPGDVFEDIRDRIRHDKGRVRHAGADYLAYRLMDAVVDNYFVILERMGEEIESQEEQIVADPSISALGRTHGWRRQMLDLRRSVWPMREVLSTLAREDSPLIRPETIPYVRDLYDHTVQVIETTEAYRDILAGMMDIYLSSASNRLNEVMKVLTMFSTIFIPLTFIVGLYGMNFKYMPELDKPWAYPAVWGVMLAITGVMIWFFKRKKWF